MMTMMMTMMTMMMTMMMTITMMMTMMRMKDLQRYSTQTADRVPTSCVQTLPFAQHHLSFYLMMMMILMTMMAVVVMNIRMGFPILFQFVFV